MTMYIKTVETDLTDGSAVFDVVLRCEASGQIFQWACVSEKDADAFGEKLLGLIAEHTVHNVKLGMGT